MSMPTIWVPNKNQNDYSAAERFGNLVYLTDGPISRFAVNQLYKTVEDKMMKSGEEDFILISSLAIICSLASVIQAAKFRRVNYLLYSPTDGYTSRTIEV